MGKGAGGGLGDSAETEGKYNDLLTIPTVPGLSRFSSAFKTVHPLRVRKFMSWKGHSLTLCSKSRNTFCFVRREFSNMSTEMVKFNRADGTEVPAYASAAGPKGGLVRLGSCSRRPPRWIHVAVASSASTDADDDADADADDDDDDDVDVDVEGFTSDIPAFYIHFDPGNNRVVGHQ
eukprot:740678-Hanusia_phi.AAC.3